MSYKPEMIYFVLPIANTKCILSYTFLKSYLDIKLWVTQRLKFLASSFLLLKIKVYSPGSDTIIVLLVHLFSVIAIDCFSSSSKPDTASETFLMSSISQTSEA